MWNRCARLVVALLAAGDRRRALLWLGSPRPASRPPARGAARAVPQAAGQMGKSRPSSTKNEWSCSTGIPRATAEWRPTSARAAGCRWPQPGDQAALQNIARRLKSGRSTSGRANRRRRAVDQAAPRSALEPSTATASKRTMTLRGPPGCALFDAEDCCFTGLKAAFTRLPGWTICDRGTTAECRRGEALIQA